MFTFAFSCIDAGMDLQYREMGWPAGPIPRVCTRIGSAAQQHRTVNEGLAYRNGVAGGPVAILPRLRRRFAVE
jgi:hypothetical protein